MQLLAICAFVSAVAANPAPLLSARVNQAASELEIANQANYKLFAQHPQLKTVFQEAADKAIKNHAAVMLAAAGKNRIVTLDIPGKPWDTPQLAHELERWKQDGRDVSLLIGGPEGLSPACKAAAEQSWSLSALTLPHPLVRVLVAESLYRAWSITTNHPYHRE